jgi:ribosome-binding protein aMBF1 (putative translation factor)
MKTAKKKKLESHGWKVSDASDFLQLSDAEVALLEMRSALGARVRKLRAQASLTQSELAGRMSSSQSRVAKIEAGHPSVSLDLMVRALITLGADRREVGACIAAPAA